MKKIFFSTALLVITIMVSCSKQSNDKSSNVPTPPAASCNSVDSKFIADVNPIILSSCATSSSCHANGSSNGPGALTNYDLIKNAGQSIKSAVQSGRMPKGGSLSAAQIQKIACWVDAGSPNN